MNKIPVYFCLGCIALMLVFCFYFYIRGELELKKEKEKEKKKAEQNAKIEQNTIDQIEQITTGDIEHDIAAGANVLHDLANRRK